LIAAHADWSVDSRKRWMTVAARRGADWKMSPPEPVGDVGTLPARLGRKAEGEPVVLGLDLPIGLPRDFARRHATEPDFPAFLRALAERPAFFDVCSDVADISGQRPFYPRRGRAGVTRAPHVAALGFETFAQMSRLCDRKTADRPAGASLFWTLGANQVGKAALSAWRDLLLPGMMDARAFHLWPFDGRLNDLVARGGVVIAETYPAEALRHLGLKLAGSKRRQADRAALAPALLAAMAALRVDPDPALASGSIEGFGARADGEDRFDSLLGLLCVINVLDGNRGEGVPDDPWINAWEGWVLGQAAPPLHA
jgi:hypothetical protein